MNKTGLIGLAVVFVAAGVLIAVTAPTWRDRMRGAPDVRVLRTVVDESWKKQDWLKDYQLVERSGRVFDSQELNGQVHVVSFFFASCPGPCFKQNTVLAQVHKEFAAQGVTFVSITCDPDNDTPLVLNQYARQFNADPKRWLFLTGEMLHLQRVGAEVYQVALDKGTHTEYFLVFDKWGQRRGKFDWKQPKDMAEMKKLLTAFLAETSPPEKPPAATPAPISDEDETDPAPPAAKAESVGQKNDE